MTAVIVLCTGNVCRSPIAEGLLRRATENRPVGPAITVSSAGTAGWEGSPATPDRAWRPPSIWCSAWRGSIGT